MLMEKRRESDMSLIHLGKWYIRRSRSLLPMKSSSKRISSIGFNKSLTLLLQKRCQPFVGPQNPGIKLRLSEDVFRLGLYKQIEMRFEADIVYVTRLIPYCRLLPIPTEQTLEKRTP